MDNEPAAQASSSAMQPSRPVERSSPSPAHGARPSYEDGISWGNAAFVTRRDGEGASYTSYAWYASHE